MHGRAQRSMKIINRRSQSTKLKRCLDFIRRKLKMISCTRLQYGSEEEEDDDHNKDRKLKTISCTRLQYGSEEEDDDHNKDLKLKTISCTRLQYGSEEEEDDDHNKDRNLKTICPREEYFRFEDDHSKDLKLKAICTIKQYKSEDDQEDRWSKQLPDDVMQLILQRLPMSDYLSCRDICPCWRAAIDSKRCLPAHNELIPWLLVDTCGSFYIKDDCFLSDRKICKQNKYYPWDCAGTIDGWLIMDSRIWQKFFFLSPVSGARVMLPSHPSLFTRVKLVASSAPTKLRLQQQQRSCYVTCLHLKDEGRLAFCMPGDKSWTFIEAEGDHEKALKFYDTEIVDGKLYAVGSHALEFLMVFDIQLDTHGRRKHTYTAERLVTLHPNVDTIVDEGVYHRHCYLAKGSESKELFMILRKASWVKTHGFQVLKLEYNATNGPQWVETVDLGDRVIFIGGINNKCISSNDQTLRNSIYFVFDNYCTRESGVFSLTNRSIRPLTFPKDQSHSGLNYTLWFTPNPW